MTSVLLGTMLTALQLSPLLGVNPNPSLVRNSSSAIVANVVVVAHCRRRSSSLTTLAALSSPSRQRPLELLVDFGVFA